MAFSFQASPAGRDASVSAALTANPGLRLAALDFSRAPLSRPHRLAIKDAVAGVARSFLTGTGLFAAGDVDSLFASGDAGLRTIESTTGGISADRLCDLQEKLLNKVCASLHADLIGSANATRLDIALNLDHVRIGHDEAVAVLAAKGYRVFPGAPLDREAESALARLCGGLPVRLTGIPGGQGRSAAYVLPFAGTVFTAASTADGRAVFGLAADRLVQYVLGRESVREIASGAADDDRRAEAARAS